MILNLRDWLNQLKVVYPELETLPPAGSTVLDAAEKAVGALPLVLKDLLRQSNGLACRSFRLYSAFDRDQPKKTWESLQRANDPERTRALGSNQKLLAQFLVFADIGNGCALFSRGDSSIWFEEFHDDEVRQTDLGLREFVETMIKNAE